MSAITSFCAYESDDTSAPCMYVCMIYIFCYRITTRQNETEREMRRWRSRRRLHVCARIHDRFIKYSEWSWSLVALVIQRHFRFVDQTRHFEDVDLHALLVLVALVSHNV